MDRQGSNFFDGMSTSKRYVKIKCCCNHFYQKKNDFKGVVDLVRNQAIVWDDAEWEQL
jgi:elongation factor G